MTGDDQVTGTGVVPGPDRVTGTGAVPGPDQVTGTGAVPGPGRVPGPDRLPVADLDRASVATAAGLLRPSCASTRWIERLVSGRPYGTLPALVTESDDTIAALGWPDIEQALAAHPRIGGRPAPGDAADRRPGPGPEGGDRETAWSRQEQAGARNAPADVQAGLRAGNAAYEERFGHVFLICATGRSAASMLAALQARLGHDPAREREVVRDELTKIVRLRLGKAFA
jgi:2-oxo-4-hydroxy-4-carboxy-5-ureidoimidazoline decarboxylase